MKKIKRAKLHVTILLGGVNMQDNLDPARKTGLQVLACDDKQMLYAFYNGEFAEIPYADVAHMIPADQAALKAIFDKEFASPQVMGPPAPFVAKDAIIGGQKNRNKIQTNLNAQASTPHDHVFAGSGSGKTNDK